MGNAADGMRAVFFCRSNFSPPSLKLLVFLLAGILEFALAGQQYFDYRYHYSIWPPNFWHQTDDSDSQTSWQSRDQQLQLTVEILDRTRFGSLAALEKVTLRNWSARRAAVATSFEASPSWFSPFSNLDHHYQQPDGSGLLFSYRRQQHSGWLLLWQNSQWLYRIRAESSSPLSLQQAAALLSALDTFAPLPQGVWRRGLIGELLLQQGTSAPVQPLAYQKNRARWTEKNWQAINRASQAHIEREYLLLNLSWQQNYRIFYALERYYQLLFRHNFASFSSLLKLLDTRKMTAIYPSQESTTTSPSTAAKQSEEMVTSELAPSANSFSQQTLPPPEPLAAQDTSTSSATETVQPPVTPLTLAALRLTAPTAPATPAATTELQPHLLPNQKDILELLYAFQAKQAQRQRGFPPQLQPLLANFWADAPDLDTLLLNTSILLSHLGYRSIILLSPKYRYTLLGVEMAGDGARVSWFGRSYLLLDFDQTVDIGWVPGQVADLKSWQVVAFPAYSPPEP